MSDHYRTDDERIVAEFEAPEYYPSPTVVPDTQTGFDIGGNWHIQIERTDIAQLPFTGGRWDDMGRY